jgi:hypothetical protein
VERPHPELRDRRAVLDVLVGTKEDGTAAVRARGEDERVVPDENANDLAADELFLGDVGERQRCLAASARAEIERQAVGRRTTAREVVGGDDAGDDGVELGRRVLGAQLALLDAEVLGAFPDDEATDLGEKLAIVLDRGEVVAGQRPDPAGEARRAVGKEDLRLAHPSRVEEELARRRIRVVVLVPDGYVEVAEGNPGGLAAPARLQELAVERKQAEKGLAGARRGSALEAGAKAERTDCDHEHGRDYLASRGLGFRAWTS